MKDWSIQKITLYLKEQETLSANEINLLKADKRKGVILALEKWERQKAKRDAEVSHFFELQEFEKHLHEAGFEAIAGVDEVGRGPLAGPVVAGAVILTREAFLPESGLVGLNDSKQLSHEKRAHFVSLIKSNALAYGIGIATAKEIDEVNIYQATKLAMTRAIERLNVKPDHLLIDALNLPIEVAQTPLIKGDARSLSIAAASILAKEFRDDLMAKLDDIYPGYHFADHAGYGTKAHLEAVGKFGPCPEHRLSFAPFKVG
ncbi:ribonuclease HII [Pullulanibacillus sp. KACC 23026]|uniref:ribonuclease HII n=1 Tax=Pullulanibacillus sp. KACC 23026 TaxID=3028315 RepID=UPI0023AFE9AE|nr:ribonuclease HII [Pullulanibacillus sp. KACC 23026]WEG11601.1 ribonuclease HII [Pullulanibacillus sp. KACC 23026]